MTSDEIRMTNTSTAGARLLPDLDFEFQIDSELLGDFRAGQIDQPMHILRRGAGMRDDEIGVAIAEFGLADPRPFEPRLVDQPARAHPARILENTAGGLKGEGLRRL